MKNFLIGIALLFILSLVFIGGGYVLGLIFSILPGFNAILTGVSFLTPEMLPTIFAWLVMIGGIATILIASSVQSGTVKVKVGGDE
ncbi:hypothetical protein [Oceanobacillus sojae]|uniref:hypothetical protein n=1 Tax=Oceanobacillus sojae TaxID=582851 RepID=UPI00362D76C0